MSEQHLSRAEIIQAMGFLAGRPEYKKKPPEELIALACQLLFKIGDVYEIEWLRHNLERNKERTERERILLDHEAAVLFLPRKNEDQDRKLERVAEFKDFMKNPVELAGDVYLEHLWQTRPREFESGNWTYGLCLLLKEYFPKWERIKRQRTAKAKKDKISLLTDSAKGLTEEKEGQPE
jgi:hypothetical protein